MAIERSRNESRGSREIFDGNKSQESRLRREKTIENIPDLMDSEQFALGSGQHVQGR